MGDVAWTGKAYSFDWTKEKNWSTETVPTPGDDVVIDLHGAWSVPRPPMNTTVRTLKLVGEGLGGRLAVTEGFDWQGGELYDGIDLGSASMAVRGQALHRTRGAIDVLSGATFSDAVVALDGQAILTNDSNFRCAGDVRFAWVAGGSPKIDGPGGWMIETGTTTFDDLPVLLSGVVVIDPDSVLIVRSQTIPTALIGSCRISGGGVFRVTGAFGRLYATQGTRIEAGTTFELGEGGTVEANGDMDQYANSIGPVRGVQRLNIDGVFRWLGGIVRGDVTLGGSSVLRVDGTDRHFHESGSLRIAGSGAIQSAANVVVNKGTWIVTGSLSLQGPLRIPEGSGWRLANSGLIEVDGTAPVHLGNNPLENKGKIIVLSGVLDLDIQRDRFVQRTNGVLELARGTEIDTKYGLDIDGSVVGSGRLGGDFEIRGRIMPGTADEPGTLSISGTLQLASTTTTTINIWGPQQFDRVVSDQQLGVAGRLTATCESYRLQAEDSFDVVAGPNGSVVSGRFETATLPRPMDNRYLYVQYSGNSVQLRTGSNALGFDLRDPPDRDVLRAWVQDADYEWIGYYLHSPCHSASWMGSRQFLVDFRLGTAVIFVGQQAPGGPCRANDLSARAGRADATTAIQRTRDEGFPALSWIYLDVERVQDAAYTDDVLEYVDSWVRTVLGDGDFNPGLYAHRADLPALDGIVTPAFQAQGRRDRARYWITGGPRQVAATDPPSRSGVPEATIWQQRLDFLEVNAGHGLLIDRNVSYLADPSAP